LSLIETTWKLTPSKETWQIFQLYHLGGLMKAGFIMTAFYEDRRPEESNNPIRHFMPSYYVARLQKI